MLYMHHAVQPFRIKNGIVFLSTRAVGGKADQHCELIFYRRHITSVEVGHFAADVNGLNPVEARRFSFVHGEGLREGWFSLCDERLGIAQKVTKRI